MSKPDLGIIGGGQLGSLLASAAKKLNIKTVVLSDDKDAPAINFADEFIYGDYQDINIINNFLEKVDLVTYEFENIPYDILKKINETKSVLPSPEINKLIQNRMTEKEFLNKNNITTTQFVSINDLDDIKINEISKDLIYLVPTGSKMEEAAKKLNMRIACEIFADRNYEDDGNLVSRKKPHALITDPEEAKKHVLNMVKNQSLNCHSGKQIPCEIDSVCIHGDNESSLSTAKSIKENLIENGLKLKPLNKMEKFKND